MIEQNSFLGTKKTNKSRPDFYRGFLGCIERSLERKVDAAASSNGGGKFPPAGGCKNFSSVKIGF